MSTKAARPPKAPQRTKREEVRCEVNAIALRVKSEVSCSYQQIANTLGVDERMARNLFHAPTKMPLRFADVVALGRDPNTAEFARRLLLAALATLDTQQLRAVDLTRMASSPLPADREIVVSVLRPLAEQLGLVPMNGTSTAEVTQT